MTSSICFVYKKVNPRLVSEGKLHCSAVNKRQSAVINDNYQVLSEIPPRAAVVLFRFKTHCTASFAPLFRYSGTLILLNLIYLFKCI